MTENLLSEHGQTVWARESVGAKKSHAGASAVLTDLQGIDNDVFLGIVLVRHHLFHQNHAQNVLCCIKVAPHRWVQSSVQGYLSQRITAEDCV